MGKMHMEVCLDLCCYEGEFYNRGQREIYSLFIVVIVFRFDRILLSFPQEPHNILDGLYRVEGTNSVTKKRKRKTNLRRDITLTRMIPRSFIW